MAKTIEESYILNKIEKASKKKMEYLEADRNNQADKWELEEEILNKIYRLMENGYKYRKEKEKQNAKN